MTINNLTWMSGNSRNIFISSNAFDNPSTFTKYDNSNYTAPSYGEVFIDDNITTFIGTSIFDGLELQGAYPNTVGSFDNVGADGLMFIIENLDASTQTINSFDMEIINYTPAGNYEYRVYLQNTQPTSGLKAQLSLSTSADWTLLKTGIMTVPITTNTAFQTINPNMNLSVDIPSGEFQAFYITFTTNNVYRLIHIYNGVDKNDGVLQIFSAGARRQYPFIGSTTGDRTYVGKVYYNATPSSLVDYNYYEGISGALLKTNVEDAETSMGTSITEVRVGYSVTAIGSLDDTISTSPLYNQDGLSSVIFKSTSGCSYIGSNAFNNCINLRNFNGPASLLNLGDSSFESSGLINLDISSGVTNIGNKTYKNCSNLLDLSFPASLITMGDEAFNSVGISDLILPNNLQTVPDGAFISCLQLQTIDFGTGVSSVGISSFAGDTGLLSVYFPNNIKEIGVSAFYNCTGLSLVDMGISIIKVGDDAFNGD